MNTEGNIHPNNEQIFAPHQERVGNQVSSR